LVCCARLICSAASRHSMRCVEMGMKSRTVSRRADATFGQPPPRPALFSRHSHSFPTALQDMTYPMSMYRNRYFLLGILLILLGIQFRMIDSFVLNESATHALARFNKSAPVADNSGVSSLFVQMYPKPGKRIEPPRWMGLAMITLGAVISCHALVIPGREV
jgi:hypothetical protein